MVMFLRRLLAWLLGLGILAALIWGVWLGVDWVAGAGDGEPQAEVRVTAEVGRRSLERTVVTRGVTGFVPAGELRAGTGGMVTRLPLVLGDVISSGDVVAVIDGRTVVAVSGVDPFWRNLARNDRGPDVEALQGLLFEAGFLASQPDGSFGVGTENAVKAWQEHFGYAIPDGVFQVGDVVIGDWPLRVGQVRAATGDLVSSGQGLAALTLDEPGVTIELTPSNWLRVHVGALVRVEVSATGRQADGVLAVLADEPVETADGSLIFPGQVRLDQDLEAPEGTQTQVTVIVDRVEDVVVVPVASVVSDGGGGAVVRVVEPGGGLRTVPVELGMSQGAWVEVVSGVEEGDTVLVAATFGES